jgi:transposase
VLKPAADPLYAVLEKLEEEIRHFDKQIEEIAERYPETRVVSQPKGVGTLTALVFMLAAHAHAGRTHAVRSIVI